jgi:hypothetical protein
LETETIMPTSTANMLDALRKPFVTDIDSLCLPIQTNRQNKTPSQGMHSTTMRHYLRIFFIPNTAVSEGIKPSDSIGDVLSTKYCSPTQLCMTITKQEGSANTAKSTPPFSAQLITSMRNLRSVTCKFCNTHFHMIDGFSA